MSLVLALPVGPAAAQFGPPAPVPENLCEPSFAVTDAGASGTSLLIKQLQFGGYEATLHVYRQDDEDCVFDGDELIWFVLAIRNHLPVSRSLFFNTSRQRELDVVSAATASSSIAGATTWRGTTSRRASTSPVQDEAAPCLVGRQGRGRAAGCARCL